MFSYTGILLIPSNYSFYYLTAPWEKAALLFSFFISSVRQRGEYGRKGIGGDGWGNREVANLKDGEEVGEEKTE